MKYIAFDFDGILVEHAMPGIGEPIIENIDTLKAFKHKGDKIIIWTGRGGKLLEEMKEWLNNNNVPYDWINENPDIDTLGDYSRKLFADVYYDDRNGFIKSKIKDNIPYSVEEVIKFFEGNK